MCCAIVLDVKNHSFSSERDFVASNSPCADV